MVNRSRKINDEIRKELVRNAEAISSWKQLYIEDSEDDEDDLENDKI